MIFEINSELSLGELDLRKAARTSLVSSLAPGAGKKREDVSQASATIGEITGYLGCVSCHEENSGRASILAVWARLSTTHAIKCWQRVSASVIASSGSPGDVSCSQSTLAIS